MFHILCMSADCIVADDNPSLDLISIKNLNLNLNLLHLNVNNITNISTLLLLMPSTDRHQRIDDDGRDCI
jgi:hypothetical protein